MALHRIAFHRSPVLLLVLGVLSVAVEMLSRSYLTDPFTGWLLAMVSLVAWVIIAARAGIACLRPRWLVAVSGAMVVFVPLLGLFRAIDA